MKNGRAHTETHIRNIWPYLHLCCGSLEMAPLRVNVYTVAIAITRMAVSVPCDLISNAIRSTSDQLTWTVTCSTNPLNTQARLAPKGFLVARITMPPTLPFNELRKSVELIRVGNITISIVVRTSYSQIYYQNMTEMML